MAYLSRDDVDNFAEQILCNFWKAECLKGRIGYNVEPTRLSQFYGFNILYVTITRAGSVLGQISIGKMWTPIMDPNGNDIRFFLDEKNHSLLFLLLINFQLQPLPKYKNGASVKLAPT